MRRREFITLVGGAEVAVKSELGRCMTSGH
jgi:hypothetical protein